MRTAIRTSPRTQSFQAGGQVELPPGLPQGLPPGAPGLFPPPVEQQQASPVQAPPGASGPTPQAIPQGDQPTAQLPPQQGAIDTGSPMPSVAAQPHGAMPDPEQDVAAADEAEQAAWAQPPGAVRSNGKFIMEKPVDIKPEQHRDYEKLKAMRDMLKDVYDQDTTKTKSQYKYAVAQIKTLAGQIAHDTNTQNKQAHADWTREEARQQKEADAKYDSRNAEKHLDTFDQQIQTEGQTFQKVIKDGKPEASHQAQVQWAGSPANDAVMSKTQRASVAQDLLALNPRLAGAPELAAQVLMTIASPVAIDGTPANGRRGRAGANYNPRRPDIRGNYILEVPNFGTVRISPEMYDIAKKARYRGYDAMLKFQAKQVSDKADASKPGWIARQFQ